MDAITIKQVQLFPIAMPLVERLGTSFGKEPFKTAILVRLETTDGVVGWGETSSEINPGYSYETMGTAMHVMTQFLIPKVLGQTVAHPTDVPALLSKVRVASAGTPRHRGGGVGRLRQDERNEPGRVIRRFPAENQR